MLDEATTLHPRLREPDALAALRAEWVEARCLRVDEVLRPGLAVAIADAVLRRPFELYQQHDAEIRCVIWRQHHEFPGPDDPDLAGPLAEARRLVTVDLPALANAIVGRPLRRPEVAGMNFDCYRKGSYLDEHTDQAPHRLVAYVVGLTRDRWPPDRGGWLEFLAADAATVIERRRPGFDTLDLYAMYPMLRWHRLPLLRDRVVRLTANGWLSGDVMDPLEA